MVRKEETSKKQCENRTTNQKWKQLRFRVAQYGRECCSFDILNKLYHYKQQFSGRSLSLCHQCVCRVPCAACTPQWQRLTEYHRRRWRRRLTILLRNCFEINIVNIWRNAAHIFSFSFFFSSQFRRFIPTMEKRFSAARTAHAECKQWAVACAVWSAPKGSYSRGSLFMNSFVNGSIRYGRICVSVSHN